MNSAEKLFELCEFYLANEISISNKTITSVKDTFIINVMSFFGLIGMVLVYILLVMRKTSIELPIYKRTVILDIKSGLILKKHDIHKEQHLLLFQRFHFPSMKIIEEIKVAYLKYKTSLLAGLEPIERRTRDSSNEMAGKSKEIRNTNVSKQASQNRVYLLWLLYFYVHRSILLANFKLLSPNISRVVTIDEYTPQIAAYISVFAENKIPIVLYMPLKTVLHEVALKSIELYESIIVSNGADADFLESHSIKNIYLEKRDNELVKLNTEISPRVGVFLGSYYNSETEVLSKLIIEILIPFCNKLKYNWGLSSLKVFSHPNDIRPRKILLNSNICVDNQIDRNEGRMTDFDIVIVGNTSVAEEALSSGIPVVYAGFLDTYCRDLCGYVKSGVVVDATDSLPSLSEVRAFYERPQTKKMLDKFFFGADGHQRVDFIALISK